MLEKGHPVVFTLSGKAHSGKDTCGEMIKTYLESTGYNVLWINYADFLKVICARNFNYDDNNKEAGRKTLQTFGTEVVRGKEELFWVHTVYHTFDVLRHEYDAFIVSDARFDNELKPFPYYLTYPIINIFVNRDVNGELGEFEAAHVSEKMANEPDLKKYSFVVDNNGTFDETNDQIIQLVDMSIDKAHKLLSYQRFGTIFTEETAWEKVLEEDKVDEQVS